MNSRYREFDDFVSDSSSASRVSSNMEREVDELTKNIQLFSNNVMMLDRKCSTFSYSQKHHLKQEIMSLFGDTAQLAKIADGSAKRIQNQKSRLSQPQRVQFDRLLKVFNESIGKFRDLQQVTAEIEKTRTGSFVEEEEDRSPHQRAGTGYGSSYESREDEHLVPERVHVDVQKMAQLDADMDEARERDQAMRQLETDILDINDIFRDLGTLVSEQGDMIDSIEANVETAAIKVEHGNKELASAARHKSCSRKLTCCIVIILVVVLVLVIIAIIVGLKIAKII